MRSIYHGELGKKTFDTPVHLAGIEVAHIGRHKEVTEVEVILTLADGSTTRLPSKSLGPGWKNGKLLFSLVPNAASLEVTAIEIPQKTALSSMRIWTIESPYSPGKP